MVWYRYDKKQTTDDLLNLSVSYMKKQKCWCESSINNGVLTWKRYFADGTHMERGAISFLSNFIGENHYLELDYLFQKKEHLKYRVQLIKSYPYFGGVRYWFKCPKCGRKVSSLYCQKYFLCRHCLNLCYKTQQMSLRDRLMEKSLKYQNKAMENNCKKRWIHWKTFEKLMDKSDFYEELYLKMIGERLRFN